MAARKMKMSDGEEEEVGHKGVTKFTHGCRAFRMAFTKVMKKSTQADPLLGPVLSAHRKLVAKKLAEEVDEQNTKGDVKKERHLAAEEGHVKPANFLDSKEKFLISVATKGVVRLFNAVNKSQNPQKGLNPSRSKDARALARRRKEAFLSEMKKPAAGGDDKYPSFGSVMVSASTGGEDQPSWAPLPGGHMPTSSKLKDWDELKDSSTPAGSEIRSLGSSSGED